MLGLILAFAFITRIFNVSTPPTYYFDEVYNAFTTQEFVKGNIDAYEWFHTSPVPGTAYGWTHPPLAKLMASLGILAFGDNSFGWRIVNVFLGVGCIYLTYLISLKLLNARRYALYAAAFAAMDGLILTQSRINMNDIAALFFILLSFYAFIRYQLNPTRYTLLTVGISLGLLIATKWTGLYAIAVFGVWIGLQSFWSSLKDSPFALVRTVFLILIGLIIIPGCIYLLSYTQYFILGGTWKNFLELQNQMWWYNTTLKATHTYQSSWWTWPIMLRPVWYFVDYAGDKIANIYGMGNPILWWLGIPAIIFTTYSALRTKSWKLWIIITGFLTFWLPWARAPRIMFLYHYLPSIPFLCIALAYTLSRLPKWVTLGSSVLILGSFIYFYPIWVGIHLPKTLVNQYFWFPSWR